MILQFLNFLTGYVTFRVRGSFCDLFFKDCKQYNIPLFNIKFQNGEYLCKCFINDYKKLRKIRRKSCVSIKQVKKQGIRFFIFNNRKRIGIPIGILAAILFLSFASSRIWRIEVVGVDEDIIPSVYTALNRLNVKNGVKKSALNTKSLSHQLVLELPEICWSAFNINGSVLTVEGDMKTVAPDTADDKKPCHIIADCDGIIEHMEVFKGSSQTVTGSAVKKGDLLVSGIIELSNGTTAFVRSNAKITVTSSKELHFEIPLTQTLSVRTGREKTLKFLSLYNIDFPLYLMLPSYKECQSEIVSKPAEINDKLLPLSVSSISFYETKKQTVTYSVKEATEMLNKMLEKAEKEEFKDAEILEKQETFSQNEDTLSVTVKYLLKKSCGKTQEIALNP